MSINEIIANSQKYTASPVSNYLSARQDQQVHQMRNLGMEKQQREMTRQREKDKIQKIAMYMKGAEKNTYYSRANALYRDYGIKMPTDWNENTKQSINNVLDATGMRDEPIEKFIDLGDGLQKNLTTDEIGEYRTPTKANAPQQPYGKPRALDADPNRLAQFPVDARGNEIPGKAVNMYSKIDQTESGVPGQFSGMSKQANTVLDKEVIQQAKMRDGINLLSNNYNKFKESGYSKNKLTSWASSIGNAAENMGIDLPDGWNAQNAAYDDLMVSSGRVLDAYRKVVTGSQASAIELQKFLLNRVPNEGDAETRFEAKMKAMIDFDDMARVRLNRLKQDGWSYSGMSGDGDNAVPIYSKNNQLVAADQIQSIDSIPVFNDRRNQIMSQLANGRLRNEVPKKERLRMRDETIRRLQKEGYNVSINR